VTIYLLHRLPSSRLYTYNSWLRTILLFPSSHLVYTIAIPICCRSQRQPQQHIRLQCLRCGLVESNLTGNYILKKKHKDHVREASAICSIQTVAERLVFENLDSTHLNLDALKTAGATHVICGLDWGVRTVVKVMEKATSRDDTSDIRGNASGSRGTPGKKSGDANKADGVEPHGLEKERAQEDTESKGWGGKTFDLMGR
jgi:hypothetical protein